MSFRAGYRNPINYLNWIKVGWSSFFLWFLPRHWKGTAAIQQILKTHRSLLNGLRMVGLAGWNRVFVGGKQQNKRGDDTWSGIYREEWAKILADEEFLTNVKPSELESSVFSCEWNTRWLCKLHPQTCWRLPCTPPKPFGPNISRIMGVLLVVDLNCGMV